MLCIFWREPRIVGSVSSTYPTVEAALAAKISASINGLQGRVFVDFDGGIATPKLMVYLTGSDDDEHYNGGFRTKYYIQLSLFDTDLSRRTRLVQELVLLVSGRNSIDLEPGPLKYKYRDMRVRDIVTRFPDPVREFDGKSIRQSIINIEVDVDCQY